MGKKRSREKATKPAKPHPAYPLTAHNNGQWCKKVLGKVHFFGVWDDPQSALELWLSQKDELLAGRVPRQPDDNRLSVESLANQFLARQDARCARGEITARTFDDYVRVGKMLVEHLGRSIAVEQLRPADFAALRAAIGEYAVSIQGKLLTISRMYFGWGWESELLEKPVRFGPDFKPPSRKSVRIAKAKKGKQLLERDELLALLGAAREPLRTMILLAVNGGLGNTDLGSMTVGSIKGEFLELYRQKTGIGRRIPLWPESIAALQELTRGRKHGELVFVTRQGNSYVRDYIAEESGSHVKCDEIAKEFSKLAKRCKLSRLGLTFYALRHTFQTIGDGALDPIATSGIMGHIDSSMAGRYRERIDDDRLRKVTEHVRIWLFGDDAK